MKAEAILVTIVAAAASWPAMGDALRVATDIPPVQALVARVMQGVGAPELILPPGATPHGHAMRPSEAAALAEADLVIWMGESLTPWLGRSVEALSSGRSLELLDVDGTLLLDNREGMGAGDDAHTEEARGGHAPTGHAEGGIDPHAWLDPENARLWLDAIAAALAEADPGNAGTYAANAATGGAELAALTAELSQALAPVQGQPFIVFHDAYRYFEHRFGLDAAGAISLGDASPPGAARLAGIRQTIRDTGARCVFAEPQFAPDLIETAIEGTGARPAVLDPLGTTLEPGPELYPRLMRGLAGDLLSCLEPPD